MKKKSFYGAGDSIRPTGAWCWRRILSLELSDAPSAGFGYKCGRSDNVFFSGIVSTVTIFGIMWYSLVISATSHMLLTSSTQISRSNKLTTLLNHLPSYNRCDLTLSRRPLSFLKPPPQTEYSTKKR
jgi:hypothetical protein